MEGIWATSAAAGAEVHRRPGALSVSIVVPSARRPEQLRACLASIAAQATSVVHDTVVIADRDPVVPQIVGEFDLASGPGGPRFTSVLGAGTPAGLRNQALDLVAGDLILFLDDDATIPAGFLDELVLLSEAYPEAGVLGGPNTTPSGSPPFEVVQGAVLSSVLGGGPVRSRYGPRRAGWADETTFTLCNLTVRRAVLRAFDESLLCAEENELLRGLRAAAVPMLYSPSLSAEHERRHTWRAFARQMHKYGRGRGQLLRRGSSGLVVGPVVLLVLLVYLVSMPVSVAVLGPPALLPLALYAAAVAAQAGWIAHTLRRPGAAADAARLLVTVHVGYAAGVLRSLVRDPGAR